MTEAATILEAVQGLPCARLVDKPATLPIVAFVSGPYRDARGIWYVQENIRDAEEVALKLWQLGVPTICPHKNTAFYDGAADDKVWLDGDLEMLRRCDVVVCVNGWSNSSGAVAEVNLAHSLGIPVFQQDEHDLYTWIAHKRENYGG